MLWAVAAALILMAALAHPVAASHSIPATLQWWDLNNDGRRQATEGDRAFQRIGGSWTTDKTNGTSAAAQAWRDFSSWNPTIVTTTTVASVRVDGVHPCGSWSSGSVAITCFGWSLKTDAFGDPYYDIFDVDIGIDLTPAGQSWNYDSGVPTSGEYDFRGVLAHEIGHGISLDDEYGSADCRIDLGAAYVITMCGSGELLLGSISQNLRSLESDDIQAANFIY